MGIFRVNGSLSEEEKLKTSLLNEDYESVAFCKDPKLVASNLFNSFIFKNIFKTSKIIFYNFIFVFIKKL